MKKVFLTLIFYVIVVQTNLFCQIPPTISITYDPVTNLLIPVYNGDFDPCTYDDPSQMINFIGWQDRFIDCYNATQNDCHNTCVAPWTPINSTYYNICKGQCCANQVGVRPTKIRKPASYTFFITASHVPIPLDPAVATPSIIFSSPFVPGGLPAPINIPSGTLPSPWPAAHFTDNTCYSFFLSIEYGDGTICSYRTSLCNIIG